MFVRLSGLSFSYTDSVSTLNDVTLTLATGWTGVVGPNGSWQDYPATSYRR